MDYPAVHAALIIEWTLDGHAFISVAQHEPVTIQRVEGQLVTTLATTWRPWRLATSRIGLRCVV